MHELKYANCALCHVGLSQHPILDAEKGFCCAGCHAVYRILEAKSELEDFQSHPVFQRALESGLISNPQLLEEIHARQSGEPAEESERLYLEIEDMWCPSCAEILRLYLLRHPGIQTCIVDYATDLCSLQYAPRRISKGEVFALIRSLGYAANNLQDSVGRPISPHLFLRFSVAAFCAVNIMMFSYPIYASYFHIETGGLTPLFAWGSLFFSLPIISYSAWPIWRRFSISLRLGIYGMETLVTLGVSAAYGLSLYGLYQGSTHVYFDSMAMIIVFVLLGKIIESKAKFSAKESLFRLTRSLPRRGRKRCEDGSEAFVSIKELTIGDTLVAYNGEKIVLDGIVTEGPAAVDESLVTGESVPVSKKIGDQVLGGTCLRGGSLAYQVASTAEQSSLQRIISMVEEDLSHKSNYVRAVDQIVRYFVPTVVFLALTCAAVLLSFGTGIEEALVRAVSVLLISCPCAIGIAAPLAESLLLHKLAALGVIVRNRGCLHDLGRETCYVFDKTGTITEGRFIVRSGLDTLTSTELDVLKGMSEKSIHPISLAISQALALRNCKLDRVEEHSGRGLHSEIDGEVFLLGSRLLMREHGIPIAAQTVNREDLSTRVYFSRGTELLSCIELGDAIRPDAITCLEGISDSRRVLLSGDNQAAALAVAASCPIDTVRAECTPVEKREYIQELRAKGECVAMVGDGINDAPSLTAAHIGISVLTASDISIQVSDILLSSAKLSVIPKMRQAARLGRRIVQQNLFWAFFYNCVGVGLALGGYLSPIYATFAMVASSLVVLANALRLK